MAKNVYFSHGTTTEQYLYEDLVIESLKIYGHDVYYLPRELVKEDDLFGEDVVSKFDENYLIEMYLSNYEGFEGDGTLLTKFGVRITDEATFIVSKRRWEDLISGSNNILSSKRPNEGDAIYFPLTGQIFQIKFVEHEKPFRMLNDIQSYNLVCELMEYSGERLETGVQEIDKMTRDIGYSQVIKLSTGVKDVVVTSVGSGYGSGTTALISSTAGTGATATVTIAGGTISSVNITEPGMNYSDATVTIAGGNGIGAAATAILAPRGMFSFGEIVNGQEFSAKGTCTIAGGGVNAIGLYKYGSGYTVAPSVTIGQAWIGGNSYSTGDQVWHLDKIYTAAGTGASGNTPPTHSSGSASDGNLNWTYAGTKATATTTITNGIVTAVNISNTGTGYTKAPIVIFGPSASDVKGKVIRFDPGALELELVDITGTFADNDSLIGQSSGAEWTINKFSSIEMENDPDADNLFFETEGDSIIDWSEGNPFGEFGNDADGVF